MHESRGGLIEATGSSINIDVRIARPENLPVLVSFFGQREYLVDRLARQEAGLGLLLTAWVEERPVGGVYLRMEPAEEPEIRQHLPGVPLLNHLEVLEEWRGRGIGTRLVTEAEQLLSEAGKDRVALAVEVSNSDAERLYVRLGYVHWKHPPATCFTEIMAEEGRHTSYPETCFVLSKYLREPA